MPIQLDLFADPKPAPVAIIGAVATNASLPDGTPQVAEAIALKLCNYNGFAARLFQRFIARVRELGRTDLVRGHLYPVSYDAALRLLNQIVRGVPSMQAPTATECIAAADMLREFCVLHPANDMEAQA